MNSIHFIFEWNHFVKINQISLAQPLKHSKASSSYHTLEHAQPDMLQTTYMDTIPSLCKFSVKFLLNYFTTTCTHTHIPNVT